ncbi:hypothetical protein B0H10DRAFT_2220743 [Mycena sp. CBHHK59/15]|nr:hypothetical protein B0H10DRAFT_2220743 [Mycena sp. CBHHK59/15]
MFISRRAARQQLPVQQIHTLRCLTSTSPAFRDMLDMNPREPYTFPDTASDCDVYKHWHTTDVPLPSEWSCDWRRWDGVIMFKDDEYGQNIGVSTTEVERAFNHSFKVPGRVESLGFRERTIKYLFVFAADGKYNWYCAANPDLLRHH